MPGILLGDILDAYTTFLNFVSNVADELEPVLEVLASSNLNILAPLARNLIPYVLAGLARLDVDYVAPLPVVVRQAPEINVPALADCEGLRRGGIDLEGVGE